MRSSFIAVVLLLLSVYCHAQSKNFWKSIQTPSQSRIGTKGNEPSSYKIYSLDLEGIRSELLRAPKREVATPTQQLVLEFPTYEGVTESFRVVEASVMHPDLAAKYPEIKSYAGQGIEDPSATIRFSVSPQSGFHGMILSSKKNTWYIDRYSSEDETYIVFARKDAKKEKEDFECFTEDHVELPSTKGETAGRIQTDDKKLRRYRLALSCNAEYGNIFAGSGTDAQKKANILAQMVVTMTRVNGVYERDLAITLQLIPNNDVLIYFGSTSADPWSNEFNSKTQQVIDNAIGSANYDIGHNFNTSGGGNAGCIGCVCTSGQKGSGYTGSANPTGDAFYIDYVAHEMGHQFGGYHTMNTCKRSGSGLTEVEPASGSTIMGYAGICTTNIQNASDAYFAYVNIKDISANVKTGASSGCAQSIALANNPPTANAGADYTIPKSTAFVLRGQATDPDGDALTYTWEQNDPEQASGTAAPQPTWTRGPMFRSVEGTVSPDRYMPKIEAVIANNLAPTWEVIPSVARTLNFSLTVRDNKAGGGQTAADLMRVTVAGTAGPFVVTAPNTAVSWSVGQSQTVTWDVASTSAAPVNCSTVNILLSTDGGYTYPITLVANTPNDGSQAVTVPNEVSSTCRVKVEAAANIFYDISNVNFTITGAVACNPTIPTGLTSSAVTSTGVTLSWSAVAGATYDIRYRITGSTTWLAATAGTNTYTFTGLTPSSTYEVQVRSKCTSTTSSYTPSVNFTTGSTQLAYCASNGKSTSDEYISRVGLGTINNSSGAGAGGYSDFTSISTSLVKGSSNIITITPTWPGSSYNEGYAVWIDYNKDGDFADSGELIWSKAASKTTPVSGTFTVPATATTGTTRMRVSLKYNAIPTACESFSYGEVEDYTVDITTGSSDNQAPTAPGSLTVSGITETGATLSWSASTDNTGVSGYDVLVNNAVRTTVTTLNYAVTGLLAGTTYSVGVRAKDASGNFSTVSTANVTTLPPACTEVTLTLVFDNYPEETSWTITNGGTVVASSSSYSSQPKGSTKTEKICLPAGCYTLNMKDSYGDGMCCSYGNGSFKLTDNNATVLALGSTYTSSIASNFCTGGSTARESRFDLITEVIQNNSKDYIYPVPVINTINLSEGLLSKKITAVTIFNVSGKVVKRLNLESNPMSEVDVKDLIPGIYFASFTTYKEVIQKKFIKD